MKIVSKETLYALAVISLSGYLIVEAPLVAVLLATSLFAQACYRYSPLVIFRLVGAILKMLVYNLLIAATLAVMFSLFAVLFYFLIGELKQMKYSPFEFWLMCFCTMTGALFLRLAATFSMKETYQKIKNSCHH